MKTKNTRQWLNEMIATHKDWPAKTLARAAYKKHPEAFTSLASAYGAVRQRMGIKGKASRAGKEKQSRPLRSAGEDWKQFLPSSKSEYDNPWGSVTIDGAHTVLGIYDAHIPYHDERVLHLVVDAGRRANADMVLLGGDFADCFALSKWEPDPRHRDFPAEIRAVKDGLRMIRKAFPKARIIWQLGNHEDRFERFMQHKCPELLGVDQFTYSEIYHTEEYGVELVGEKRPILLGKLHLIHGHEYSFPISNPVNPARGLFLRAKTHAVCGHFHQTSQHSEKRLDDKVVSCWSIGCACQLHPRYRPMNNWNHGFAIFRTDKSGAFDVESRKIIEGKVY